MPGTTARARNVVQEVRSGIQLVKSHTWYARYLLVRILLLGIAEAGAILGRKTYLIDNAEASERPTYVAFSNSIVGLAMLLLGGIGMAAQYAGVQTALAILALMALAGAAAGMLLPEDAQTETLDSRYKCFPLQQCPSAAN